MAKFNPNPSIAARGGLQVYMISEGFDYTLFKSLRASIGDKYGSIAKALTKKAGTKKPLRPERVKNWCQVDDKEQQEEAASESTAN